MKNFINYILLQCETESAKCVAYFSARSRDRQIINLIRCDYTLILYVVGALIHLLPLHSPPHYLFPLFACHTSTFTCSKLQQKQLLLLPLLLLWLLLLLLVATSNCSQVAAVRRTRCGTSNATSRCRSQRRRSCCKDNDASE